MHLYRCVSITEPSKLHKYFTACVVSPIRRRRLIEFTAEGDGLEAVFDTILGNHHDSIGFENLKDLTYLASGTHVAPFEHILKEYNADPTSTKIPKLRSLVCDVNVNEDFIAFLHTQPELLQLDICSESRYPFALDGVVCPSLKELSCRAVDLPALGTGRPVEQVSYYLL